MLQYDLIFTNYIFNFKISHFLRSGWLGLEGDTTHNRALSVKIQRQLLLSGREEGGLGIGTRMAWITYREGGCKDKTKQQMTGQLTLHPLRSCFPLLTGHVEDREPPSIFQVLWQFNFSKVSFSRGILGGRKLNGLSLTPTVSGNTFLFICGYICIQSVVGLVGRWTVPPDVCILTSGAYEYYLIWQRFFLQMPLC